LAVSRPSGRITDQVWRLDLATGEHSVLARSEWNAGEIYRLTAVGPWLVWVDEQPQSSHGAGPPQASPKVMWRIWAENQSTGRKILLGSSGDSVVPGAPVVRGGEGYVAWAIPDQMKASGAYEWQEFLWKPSWSAPRTLFRHTLMAPGTETFADGNLIFLGPAYNYSGAHTVGGDCWSFPLDGSGAGMVLTHTALVEGCAGEGSNLVFTEHIDPAMGSGARVKDAGENPYELVTMSLASPSTERVIHEGSMNMGGAPVVGTGFTWWVPFGDPEISSLTASAHITVSTDGSPFDWLAAAGGDMVAYFNGKGAKSRLVVAKVSISP